jgi:hypothetical protein
MKKIFDIVKNIVNNERVCDAMFNLYLRWLDECDYEDIKDYGAAIANVVGSEYKGCNIVLTKCCKRPFGFHLSIDGENLHIFVKREGDSVTICSSLM